MVVLGSGLVCAQVLLASSAGWATVGTTSGPAGASAGVAFSRTETITRDNLINGADTIVDKRTVTLTVDQTAGLRDRQEVRVSWTGAHPTAGILADANSADAAQEEYPVVLLECRGVD
jgi:hypothetical protein